MTQTARHAEDMCDNTFIRVLSSFPREVKTRDSSWSLSLSDRSCTVSSSDVRREARSIGMPPVSKNDI